MLISGRFEELDAVLRIGDIKLQPFVSSRFRLDGGTMFGVIPRVLWERKAPPDSLNRIELTVNSLLVEAGGELLLVEPGMGLNYSMKEKEAYGLEEIDARSGLEKLGLSAEEIDKVVFTHLHLDHAGGATEMDASGNVKPVFPKALHFVQAGERDCALRPHPLERASYRSADFLPIESAGLLLAVHGERKIAEGVSVEYTGGHTAGHQIVWFRSCGVEACYLGDLIPTTAHLPLKWLMSWDMDPRKVYGLRAALLDRAANRGVTLFWAHDPKVFASKVISAGGNSYKIMPGTAVHA